jgi:hypothetical protein
MGLFQREHTTIDRGADADAVRDRLAAVPLVRPCDRDRVEAALAEHLRALDLQPKPVRWVDDADPDRAARAGFLAFWAAKYKKGRPEAPGMTRTATQQALIGTGFRTTGVIGPALHEEDLDRAVKKAARRAVYGIGSTYNLAHADARNVEVVGAAADLARAMTAARAALAEKGITQSVGFLPDQAEAKRRQGEGELMDEVQVASAAAQALEAANWLARKHVVREAGAPTDAHDRVVRCYLPLVDAVEAGLWLFWVTDTDVIAVAAPQQ